MKLVLSFQVQFSLAAMRWVPGFSRLGELFLFPELKIANKINGHSLPPTMYLAGPSERENNTNEAGTR